MPRPAGAGRPAASCAWTRTACLSGRLSVSRGQSTLPYLLLLSMPRHTSSLSSSHALSSTLRRKTLSRLLSVSPISTQKGLSSRAIPDTRLLNPSRSHPDPYNFPPPHKPGNAFSLHSLLPAARRDAVALPDASRIPRSPPSRQRLSAFCFQLFSSVAPRFAHSAHTHTLTHSHTHTLTHPHTHAPTHPRTLIFSFPCYPCAIIGNGSQVTKGMIRRLARPKSS
jgi:hypothetical protein